MANSEKDLLEKLADAIPGLKGYREKESRRSSSSSVIRAARSGAWKS